MSGAPDRAIKARENSPWLHRYSEIFVPGHRVLDLGCGTGADSRDIVGYGCSVACLDIDFNRARQVPAEIECERAVGDVVAGLPFQSESFNCVVASLSLHYFTTRDTRRAVDESARVLQARGWLLCRVNAIGDVNFGYGAGEEIEPSLFRQPEGHLKRFFDAEMLRSFLVPRFEIASLEPRSIMQNGRKKRTLECLARKR